MLRPLLLRTFVLLVTTLYVVAGRAEEPLPEFRIEGHEDIARSMSDMLRLHYNPRVTNCTLWDAWLPHTTLWIAAGENSSAQVARDHYRRVFANRRISPEGYVAVQQHRGLAHSDGWPFPTWQQAGGAGYYFSIHDEVYGIQNFRMKALPDTKGWTIDGAEVVRIDPIKGLVLKGTADTITVTTPEFQCGTIVAPFVRLEWQTEHLAKDAKTSLAWRFKGQKNWAGEARREFPVVTPAEGMTFSNVPLYQSPGYDGLLTQIRWTIDGAKDAEISLKSIITAIDTRHPITGILYVQGVSEYLRWTTDLPFLKENIDRLRLAMKYTLSEMQVRERNLVHVPWVGHNGNTGLSFKDGKKRLLHGIGVGNNYWDLLPFGNDDALATIYLYDALRKMSEIETAIAIHPEWSITPPIEDQSAESLRKLSESVKAHAGAYFWSADHGRFVGWVGADGSRPDYGFTFVNLEAIYYGFATDEQANSILDWLDGKRIIEGDTSTGEDIYHWRFGPRATTKRNVENYCWVWSNPEGIPWGGQVQDGGAVMGFTYYDIMSRFKTHGPDDAARRLTELATWFREVQAEGGYRKYYSVPGRGTLQGGGPPGGLGMDQEFFESSLAPQVLLYGFLGFRPVIGGFELNPQLPSRWPSLTCTRIHIQGSIVDITATHDTIELNWIGGTPQTIDVWSLPRSDGWTLASGKASASSTNLGQWKLETASGTKHVFQRFSSKPEK